MLLLALPDFTSHWIHAIQIESDWEGSRDAFVFVDKCKPIIILFFAHNLLNSRTSFSATKFEEQQILLVQQRLFG